MEAVLASSQLGGQLFSLLSCGIRFYEAMKDAEGDIPELKREVNEFSKVIKLGQISMEDFVKTLSQEKQKQLVQKMDFNSLQIAVTENARQAEDILAKYKNTTGGKVRFVLDKDKRQDILLKLSRSTNIYTTALVTILVHAITMQNTAIGHNFEHLTEVLRGLREVQVGAVATPCPSTANAINSYVPSASTVRDNSQKVLAKTTPQSPRSNYGSKTQKETRTSKVLKRLKRPLAKDRHRRRDTEFEERSTDAQPANCGFDGGVPDTIPARPPTSPAVHSHSAPDHGPLNETGLERSPDKIHFASERGSPISQDKASVKSPSITISTEFNEAIDDLGLTDGDAVDDAVQKYHEAEPSQTSGTVSLSADKVTAEQDPTYSLDAFQCTEAECVYHKFGRIEDLFASGTSMTSATNDTSPWIFFFFQRSDRYVQFSLIPKDCRNRIIVLETIAEAVEQSPLSCVLTSKPRAGTHEQCGSLLRLFFVQPSEDDKRHLLVEWRLDLTDGPPFKWECSNLEDDDSVCIPGAINVHPNPECPALYLILRASPDGELLANEEDSKGYWWTVPSPDLCVPTGGPLIFRSYLEKTGYWPLPIFGGPSERTVTSVHSIGQEMMTTYDIRDWIDDGSSEARIEKSEIRLNWHGLAISPSPTSCLPILERKSNDKEEEGQMVGFYCKTRDDNVFYFTGHYQDELKEPEFVCSVKADSEIHLLAGCLNLLYISANNELRVSIRTVDATGAIRHETSCLPSPSNYFMTELDRLVAPGPLDGYIPPRVQEIIVKEREYHGGYNTF